MTPSDADNNDLNGHQVPLEVGANTVEVTVTAENDATGVYTVTVTRAPDTTPPRLVSKAVDAAALLLVYNENLDAGSEPAPGAFAVKVTDSASGVVVTAAPSAVDVAGAEVTLTLTTPARNGDTVTVSYTPGTPPLQDVVGNDAAAFNAQTVTNQTAAATDTKLVSLTLTADSSPVSLTPLFAANTGSYTAFVPHETALVTVTAAAVNSRAEAVVTPSDDDNNPRNGHQVPLEVGATTVEVTVTAENDATGVYTVEVTRGPAPGLVSAIVDGAALLLVYGENLDAVSQPAPGAFAVKVTDSASGVVVTAAPSAVDVAGAEVTLTLTTPARNGDTVTVTYTPGAAPLQDTAGNDAAAFNAGPVTNDTAAATDTKLASLTLTAAGSALALTPLFAANTVTYTAFVPHETALVTVTAAAADSRAEASVTPSDADADDLNGHQVPLEVGANTVEVTVTAENDTTGVYTVTVTRAPDTTPPRLVSKAVDAAALLLVYNENLDAGSEPAPGAFAVKVTDSASGVVVTAAPSAVDVAGAEVTLTLTTPARHGDTVTVSYTPGTPPLQDVVGNDAAAFNAQTVTNQTAAATDTKLVSLTLTADSSPVSLTPLFAANTGSYTAFVPHETALVTVTAAAVNSRAEAVVTPSDDDNNDVNGHQVPLEVGATTVEVTVTAENDATGVYTVEVTRGPAPGLVSAIVDGAALVLVYGENLDAVSQPAPGAFAVKVTDSASGVVVTAAPSAVDVADAEVTLTLTTPARNGDTVTVTYTPGAAPLQDTAGNDAAAFNAGPVTNDTAAATDTKLASLTLTAAGSALALTPLFAANTVTYTAFVPHETALVTVTAAAADSRAEASVTPSDADADDLNGHQVPLEVGANTVEVTVTAENDTTGVYTVTVTRAPDTTPPRLVSKAVDAAALLLVYNENLDAGSEPAPGAFAVKVTDSASGVVVTAAPSAVDVAGAEVTLTLTTPARNGDTVTVSYTPGTPPLQDVVGNDAAAFNAQTVTNQTAAATDTKLVSLTLTADSSPVSLTPLFAAGTGSYTAFVPHETALVTVTAAAVNSRAEAVVTPSDDDNNPRNGHQVPLEVGATTVEVTVTAENDATRVYTVEVTRGPAPGLVSAIVDGAALLLVYGENLDAVSQPAPGAFAVKVTDSASGVVVTAAPSAVDVAGAEVTLTLTTPARNGDTVTVTYTPGAAPLQDTAGNDAVAFNAQTVTNQTAAATDTKLASLTLTAAGSALALTPLFAANTVTYTASVPHETALVTVTAAAVGLARRGVGDPIRRRRRRPQRPPGSVGGGRQHGGGDSHRRERHDRGLHGDGDPRAGHDAAAAGLQGGRRSGAAAGLQREPRRGVGTSAGRVRGEGDRLGVGGGGDSRAERGRRRRR